MHIGLRPQGLGPGGDGWSPPPRAFFLNKKSPFSGADKNQAIKPGSVHGENSETSPVRRECSNIAAKCAKRTAKPRYRGAVCGCCSDRKYLVSIIIKLFFLAVNFDRDGEGLDILPIILGSVDAVVDDDVIASLQAELSELLEIASGYADA